MPDLKDLRALIKDHQEKDTGLTIDAELCLKTWLIQELHDLEAEMGRRKLEAVDSMADASTEDIEAEMEAKRVEIEEATILLHFKALTEPRYRDLLRDHPFGPDTSPAQDVDFYAKLTELCYRGAKWSGKEFTAAQFPWAEVRENVSFGELDPIYAVVFGLNRSKIDRPTSSRQSRPSQRI